MKWKPNTAPNWLKKYTEMIEVGTIACTDKNVRSYTVSLPTYKPKNMKRETMIKN